MLNLSSDTEQPTTPSWWPQGMADRVDETAWGKCPPPPGATEVGDWCISGGAFTNPYTRTIAGAPTDLDDWVRFVPTCIQLSDGTVRSVYVGLERMSFDGQWLDTGFGINADETRALARKLIAMADQLDSWAGAR